MSIYKQILVAVDLSEHSQIVCTKAKQLAEKFGASLSLLHVVEYIPVEAMGEALLPSVDMSEQLLSSAEQRVSRLTESCGLENVVTEIRIGNIKSELVSMAREIAADLIVLGSHERHGLVILVNHTEDTVLHAAPCDVLAVRLK